MKTLVSVMVVVALAMASPLYAATILQEDFNGAAGDAVTGTNGWTGPSTIVYSDNLIDSGTCASGAAAGDPEWPEIIKSFSPSGTQYTFSGVLRAGATGGPDAALRISSSSDSSKVLGAEVGYGELIFGVPNVVGGKYFSITPQPTNFVGVKMILEDTSMDCYYRTTDTAGSWGEWTHAGLKTGLAWSMSEYDQVTVDLHAMGVGGDVDSIMLTNNVPEPSAIVLAVTGLIGLLAYAWRKRR
jgi:hypothetical protein